jgi:hypothetical protein
MCYRCEKLPPTGYKGQKYEVSCLGFDVVDETKRHVVGWTNDPTGNGLVKMINLHPVLNSPEVREVNGFSDNFKQ